MATVFIGDVHGWSDRLERILAQVAADDELVFVGDLIDRGPQGPAVLERVHGLCASGRARCLLGNHEYALVRGLGFAAHGIAADGVQYRAWAERYGGDALLAAYGLSVEDDPAALSAALGAHLPWLAGLPWMLQGGEADRRWVAVHAGLGTQPFAAQLAALGDPGPRMRDPLATHPSALYAKQRALLVPHDLPADVCVVSGHTPVPSAVVTRSRILCDTSGGLPDRALSAVVWPEGRVLSSER